MSDKGSSGKGEVIDELGKSNKDLLKYPVKKVSSEITSNVGSDTLSLQDIYYYQLLKLVIDTQGSVTRIVKIQYPRVTIDRRISFTK